MTVIAAACCSLKLKVFISFSDFVVLPHPTVSISAAAANKAILLIVIGIGLLFLSVILNQILHKLRVAEVDGARVVLVELGDGGHIVGGQREV